MKNDSPTAPLPVQRNDMGSAAESIVRAGPAGTAEPDLPEAAEGPGTAGGAAPPERRRRRRLSRVRRWLQYVPEYLCLRLYAAAAAVAPRRLWLWCGARLGDTLYALGFYRRTVQRNMEFVGLWPADRQRGKAPVTTA